MWEYRAQLKEVVDGDTIDLRVDLGFKTYKNVRVRLPRVDTAEIYGVHEQSTEHKRGMRHKEFVQEYVDREGEWPLRLITEGETGKYGRWIGDVQPVRESEMKLSQKLIEKYPEVEK
jgi:micrococcal nuclease